MTSYEKRILIAEDEPMLRELLVTILYTNGYNVDSASNGIEAWQCLSQQSYHLLITDMFMPEMSGFELIKKVHQSETSLPIMMVSGGGNGLVADDGDTSISFKDQSANIDLFVSKPYQPIKLLQTVEKLLNPAIETLHSNPAQVQV